VGVVSTPKRIQRKRTKGWRMPEGAVYVGRPSKWGNPYGAHDGLRQQAVDDFRWMLSRAPVGDGTWGRVGETVYDTIRRELAGRDLACWCPLDDGCGNRVPCHADVLLELANAKAGIR